MANEQAPNTGGLNDPRLPVPAGTSPDPARSTFAAPAGTPDPVRSSFAKA
jgi:hypothetical protein